MRLTTTSGPEEPHTEASSSTSCSSGESPSIRAATRPRSVSGYASGNGVTGAVPEAPATSAVCWPTSVTSSSR